MLFCDLVGSTELSRQHDPEDLRELLRRYHDAVAAVVRRFGGYVANYLGDGIIAYFGWPRADEDDAVQAVRAGLAAVAAANELALRVHVGIASGTVVVGDLEGTSGRQVGAIAGETPNLAARLEALAGPGQIIIAALTRQLIGAAFVLDDLGPQQLKGITEPVRAWQVLAERSIESRFEARAGRLTRLSDASTRSRCWSIASNVPPPARVRRYCSRAKPGSASRASSSSCRSAWGEPPTPGCASSARLHIPISRSIPSFATLNTLRGFSP